GEFTRQADVLIVAAGSPHLINGDHVKEGAIAIDVGINPVRDTGGTTRLVGDMDTQSVARKAQAVTPVPGGVGPVTDVCLLENVLLAAKRSSGQAPRRREPFKDLGAGRAASPRSP